MSPQPAQPKTGEQLSAENALLRTLLRLTVQYAYDSSTALVTFSTELRRLPIPDSADLSRLLAILNGHAATANLYTARSTPLLEALGLTETVSPARAPSVRPVPQPEKHVFQRGKSNMTSALSEALIALSRAQHRGAPYWYWDAASLRVLPAEWGSPADDPAPAFTVFEALAIARSLVGIGATGQQLDVLQLARLLHAL
jgi:hypothetical protein